MFPVVLHLEVYFESSGRHQDDDLSSVRQQILTHLNDNFSCLQLGQQISSFDNPSLRETIDYILVSGYSGPQVDSKIFYLSAVNLDINLITLHDHTPKAFQEPTGIPSDDTLCDPIVTQSETSADDTPSPLRITSLPHRTLHGLYESLIFDPTVREPALPNKLLAFTTHLLHFSSTGLNPNIIHLNRVILLHGPPGTGKTSLCRALAQKLSIRLSTTFPTSTLLELHTSSLFSKFFGESVTHITNAFQTIFSLASDPSHLVLVLIDEIESIAGSRERALQTQEVGEVVRVTNALLVMLDRMRYTPNVLLLCTSNLADSMDGAFLDRVDLVEKVPLPGQGARYDILRSCFGEMVRCGLVNGAQGDLLEGSPVPEDGMLMSLSELRLSDETADESPSRRLWTLSDKCKGVSGRMLRRLPFMGLALNAAGRSWSMKTALDCLEMAMDNMKEEETKQAEP
ncbi:AAA-domain-containing protein [Microthyrium microscopicum]|uniref:AAA-domain-containing protein n=1 Tax=Microthyrium microscopicum TaxID=703497 RepID=A0A6A6U3U0_9PEZI|nr:AAA-domain-containing protein [Microthyrium microscopicum]